MRFCQLTLGFRPAALLALLAFGLAGCVKPEDGRQRLLFAFWGSTKRLEVERQIVRAFEEKHPDIDVEILAIGARYAEKIQAMMVGGVAPDVLFVDISSYPEWASRGVLKDLTPLVEELDAAYDVMPVPERAFRYRGRYYAVPVNCHGLVTFYNADILEEAGIDLPAEGFSYADLEAWAPRLAKRSGNPNAPTDFAIVLPRPYMIFWAFGATLFDDPEEPTQVTLDSTPTREALAYLQRLVGKGYAAPADVVMDHGTFELFRDGKAAFMITGRWVSSDLVGQTDFEWDVLPPPAGIAGRPTSHGGTGIAISSQTKRLDAAEKFVRFYTSPESVWMSTEAGRTAPVYRTLAESPRFLAMAPPQSMHRFVETMEEDSARIWLFGPGSSEVNEIFRNWIDPAVNNPGTPVEPIIRSATQELERWLDQQQKEQP